MSNNVGAVHSKTSSPANDSFAGLISFTGPQSTKTISLQEQQRILQEQRTKQDADERRGLDVHFEVQAGRFREPSNGSKSASERVEYAVKNRTGHTDLYKNPLNGAEQSHTIVNGSSNIPSMSNSGRSELDNDLLAFDDSPRAVGAAHNKDSGDLRGRSKISSDDYESSTPSNANILSHQIIDDDPFGLNVEINPSSTPNDNNGMQTNEDDVLGLLGRPAPELRPPTIGKALSTSEPLDHALAELMDMGFTAEKSKHALAQTESGIDVQSAVGFLLQEAHQESHQKQRKPPDTSGADHVEFTTSRKDTRQAKSSEVESNMPPWLRQQSRSSSQQRRAKSRSPVNGDRDPAKIAAEIGNNLFKTANSIWRTGAKKLNEAVSEFNSDSDTSQPKWMREAKVEPETREPRQKNRSQGSDQYDKPSDSRKLSAAKTTNITDEALLLESGNARPAPRIPQRKPPAVFDDRGRDSSRDTSPAIASKQLNHKPPVPKLMQRPSTRTTTARLNRAAVEEQISQAYISPARRKKAAPAPTVPQAAEPDLLFEASPPPAKSFHNPIPIQRPVTTTRPEIEAPARNPIPARPQAPTRHNPPIAASSIQSSATQRRAGTSAFKRGDFASATTFFTSALSFLPRDHILTIPVLTNRALSNLKTGDPKSSIADAHAALKTIGPSRGESETIEIGPGEGSREMSAFWGKAMMRQAEALEQLENWNEAASVWKLCVEAGVGAPTSTQGRTRCEKAAGRGPISVPTRRAPPPQKIDPKPITRASMLDDLSSRPNIATSEQTAEAVSRLRAANAEAEKVDEEKVALADVVDGRLTRWRKGKEGNLRALLASLETVLWEGSGWKKVGMHELIVPGRVKVVYMKGIGRVHPDKVRTSPRSEKGGSQVVDYGLTWAQLPQSATTEQKMISANVFTALNEAWDAFKRENGL